MQRTTSVYLDLIRFLAAALVFVVHANYVRFTGGLPVLWRLEALGNDAVMMFFVLSGFVIAYVSDEKEKTLKRYAISRFARLYSVAIPALMLTVVADAIGSRLSPHLYNGWWFTADNPAWRISANLLFVNELWFTSVRPFSNRPFWSLGYEFWYYAIFAAAYYLRSWHRYVTLAAITLFVGPKILMLLPVWLLGVWTYYRIKTRPLPELGGAVLAAGSLACYLAFHHLDLPRLLDDVTVRWLGRAAVEELNWSRYFLSSYVIGALVALHFVGIAAIAPRFQLLLPERPIRYLASFTFALYLFHYPLLQFFAAVVDSTGTVAYRLPLVTIGTLAVVWALAAVTEKRKSTVRRWVTLSYDAVARIGSRPAATPRH